MPLQKVRLLCFGDSLTSGYTLDGCMFHPYAHTMMKTLRVAFPEVKLDISVKGQPGDRVTSAVGNFYDRLKYEYAEHFFEDLESLYDLCFAHDARVVAITIPQWHVPGNWPTDTRDKVNDMIRNYSKENFFVFDLHNEIPYAENSHENPSLWDDGVHLTPMGYSVMGRKIASFFHPLLKEYINAKSKALPGLKTPGVGGASDSSRGNRANQGFGGPFRATSDPADEMEFEEENGDPKVLSQGYVIVRNRDLD